MENTISQAITSTTTVRMAVAKLELTFSIPILAKIEVSAAKTADKSANTTHINNYSFQNTAFIIKIIFVT